MPTIFTDTSGSNKVIPLFIDLRDRSMIYYEARGEAVTPPRDLNVDLAPKPASYSINESLVVIERGGETRRASMLSRTGAAASQSDYQRIPNIGISPNYRATTGMATGVRDHRVYSSLYQSAFTGQPTAIHSLTGGNLTQLLPQASPLPAYTPLGVVK